MTRQQMRLPWRAPAQSWPWGGVLALLAGSMISVGCGDDDGVEPEPEPPIDTIAEDIFADLGEPMPSATEAQLGTFARGREVGLRRFRPDQGFGPHFNASFCLSCHEKPVFGGSGSRYRNFLLVRQVLPDDSFVPTGVNEVQPQFLISRDARYATDSETNLMAVRNPIPFFGVGLLAEIPDEEILTREDPDDADGDGISGRANFERGFVGRFGRKAQNASIEAFIRGPLFNHLGITSNPLPDVRRAELPVASANPEGEPEGFAPGIGGISHGLLAPQVGAPNEPIADDDEAPDPELSEDALFDLVSFTMLLAPPKPDELNAETEAGRDIFVELKCDGCHTPTLRGPRGLIPAYTDLLLHDMGPELDDGIQMRDAETSEFRTAPLWGVGTTAPYLHDGRADTLDEAIRWHGGEGEASREAYVALSAADQDRLLAFLNSLGGAAQYTQGLLPPDAEVPEAGAYGGPDVTLNDAETARFVRGRQLFDRDFYMSEGLGPYFNGDACRSCHFDPVIGGSGPADVNVIRHGILDDDSGVFTAPEIGTMAYRHGVASDARPDIDNTANVFEARQTPAIFGLGAIDAIDDQVILDLQDEDDTDGDGISGRAHVLDDGRLGRFGWKAGVPSVDEFARDAMFNEIGITLPDQEGLSFGAGVDDDEIDDPEISRQDLEDLAFFMKRLAPPPRTRVNVELEDLGQEVFESAGCADCHIPELPDRDGNMVPLYSDLLLHDVAPIYMRGIEDGSANGREFRTPPLWGLGQTAPYMHDGSAYTVEDAILQHDAEAASSRNAYLQLPPEEQRALRDFLKSL